MEFENHKITEAICAFRFDPKLNEWNIGIFSEFFNKIKEYGFVQSQEQETYASNVEIDSQQPLAPISRDEKLRMAFLNVEDKQAIILAKNYISFHTVEYYPGWEEFKPNLVDRYLRMYGESGLGKGI